MAAGACPRPNPVGAAYSEWSASIPLVARSGALLSLRMRPRTRLDFEVHGNVAEGNGGRGKISRQRPESAGSPNWAAPPEASKPLALSYIPEILESMATVIYGVFWHRTEKSLRPSSRNSGNQFSRNTIPLTPAIPIVKSKSSNTGDVMIGFHC